MPSVTLASRTVYTARVVLSRPLKPLSSRAFSYVVSALEKKPELNYSRPLLQFSGKWRRSSPAITRHRSSGAHAGSVFPSQPPLKDPAHPSLFYHLTHPPTPLSRDQPAFALSFFDEPPARGGVIGWLPAETDGGDSESGLNDFVANPVFVEALHEGVRKGLLLDDIWTNGAIQTQSGWMHIFDQRNPPPLGRIPDPDDIIASVRVEDGVILIDTYVAMPSYRVCTRDGVCVLTEGLLRSVKEELARRSGKA